MEEWELAYTAGFIDGDGCIRLKLKPAGNYDIRVQVTSTDWAIIEWLRLRWGGCVGTQVHHKGGGRWRDMHYWHLTGQPSVDFLQAVQPYLLLKAPQAKLAIEAWEQRRPVPRGQRYLGVPAKIQAERRGRVLRMTALNQKGKIA